MRCSFGMSLSGASTTARCATSEAITASAGIANTGSAASAAQPTSEADSHSPPGPRMRPCNWSTEAMNGSTACAKPPADSAPTPMTAAISPR